MQAKLGRFKDKCSSLSNEMIKVMSAEIDGLKRQVVENHKIADLVLIEVKAVFLKHLAKLQSTPQPIPEEKHLAPAKQFKTREVLIESPGRVPTGNDYKHTANPSYENPIVAIHADTNNGAYRMKFESQDGTIGQHIPECSLQFARF